MNVCLFFQTIFDLLEFLVQEEELLVDGEAAIN